MMKFLWDARGMDRGPWDRVFRVHGREGSGAVGTVSAPPLTSSCGAWTSAVRLLFCGAMVEGLVTGYGRPAWAACLRAAQMCALACVVAVLAVARPVAAETPSILVHRGDQAVEVYFSVPSTMLLSLFDLSPQVIEGPDGTVDFDGLRLGTYDIGDDLFAGVTAEIGGVPATFEALSLMVHPNDAKLPMTNPIEAMIAIAVCTVPTPAVPPTLTDLHAYVGYIAYTDTPQGPIQLTMPETGRGAVTFEVMEFTDFEARGVSQIVVADGGTLRLEPGAAPHSPWTVAMAALLGLIALMLVASWVREGRARPLRLTRS